MTFFGGGRFLGRYVFLIFALAVLDSCVGPPKQDAEPTQPVATANGSTAPHETDKATNSTVYPIPDDLTPKGRVTVTSLGVTDLKKEGAPNVDAESMPALHVRMSVVNNSDPLSWDIDARMQLVRINSLKAKSVDEKGNTTGLRPHFVNAKNQELPFISVKQGETQTIDFYYDLPLELKNVTTIQNFVFDWQIATSEKVINIASGFSSVDIHPSAVAAATPPLRDEYGTESTMSNPPEIGSTTPQTSPPPRSRPKVPVDQDKGWWQDPFAWTHSTNGANGR